MNVLSEDQVRVEIVEARRLMGLWSTDFQILIKSLGYVLVRTPQKYLWMVESTLDEALKRWLYIQTHPRTG